MVSNEEIGAASLILAKAIDERAHWLEEDGVTPQGLVVNLTSLCSVLYRCIDPDELEALCQ